jgi:hypothetical protein
MPAAVRTALAGPDAGRAPLFDDPATAGASSVAYRRGVLGALESYGEISSSTHPTENLEVCSMRTYLGKPTGAATSLPGVLRTRTRSA